MWSTSSRISKSSGPGYTLQWATIGIAAIIGIAGAFETRAFASNAPVPSISAGHDLLVYDVKSVDQALNIGRVNGGIILATLPKREAWVVEQSKNENCKRGMSALLHEKWQDAIKWYSVAIQDDPNNAVAYAHRAVAHFMSLSFGKTAVVGAFSSAVRTTEGATTNMRTRVTSDLNNAIGLQPKCARLYRNRAELNFWCQFGSEASIKADCDKVAALTNDDVTSLALAGELYSLVEHSDKSVRTLNRALRVQPNSSQLYALRGRANWRLKKVQETIADETKAISLDPTNAFAFYERALGYMWDRKFKLAENDLTTALKLEPKYQDIFYHRGLARMENKDLQNALVDFNKAIELEPKPSAYLARAHCYLSLKEFANAITDCTKSLRIDSRNSKALVMRAQAHIGLNETKSAMTDLDQALRLNPNSDTALALRSKINGSEGSFEQSIGDVVEAQKAVRKGIHARDGERPSIQGFARSLEDGEERSNRLMNAKTFARGVVPPKASFEAALKGYTKVIALNKPKAETYFDRGYLYLDLRNPEAAAEDFRRCSTLSTSSHTIVLAKSLEYICLKQLGKDKQANDCIHDAILARSSDAKYAQLLRFLKGESDETTYLKSLPSANDQVTARLFAGLVAHCKKDTRNARKHFEWIRDNADQESDDYTLALVELSQLPK